MKQLVVRVFIFLTIFCASIGMYIGIDGNYGMCGALILIAIGFYIITILIVKNNCEEFENRDDTNHGT